jgi:hypothetical protein
MSARHRFRSPIRLDALKQISGDYWRVVAIGAIFTLARFSEAFLVLRAQQVGFANKWVPLVMIVMSLAYSFSAYPGWNSLGSCESAGTCWRRALCFSSWPISSSPGLTLL